MCICTSKHLYLHCFVFGTAVCINTIDSLFTYSKTQNNKEKKKTTNKNQKPNRTTYKSQYAYMLTNAYF